MITCHLCSLPFPAWANVQNHALQRSQDHFIPRSRGGIGLPFNKLPAHIACNTFRGNRPVTAALRKRCRRIAKKQFRLAPEQVLAALHHLAHVGWCWHCPTVAITS